MSQSAKKTRLSPIFSVLMFSLPILFFVLLELGLRLFGVGESLPLFVPITGFDEYLQPSEDVAKRYFPPNSVIPGIPFDSFKKQKDPSSTRIFVQGGSTAAGFPFYFGGSFADMLEQRLQQSAPNGTIEVINTAMAAVNSYTLLDFVDEIIAQDPDLVVIYAGHNEYYGALGVGSTFSLGRSPVLVRTLLRLQKFRTVQALRWILSKVASIGKRPVSEGASSTLMSQVVGEQSIPLDSDLYKAGLEQFRSNLRLLLDKYSDAGVPVYIGTVASNLRDHKPFISTLSAGTDRERFNSLADRMRAADRRQVPVDDLLSMADSLIALDPLAADPYYAKGRMLLAAGDEATALEAFTEARDRDQLRFRAPTAINNIIREEAARAGALVVETEQRLADHSKNGIIGSELMTEHLHPNVEGYFQLASAYYDKLASDETIDDWTTTITDSLARAELLVTPVDSLVGVLRIKQLTSSWPFQPEGTLAGFSVPESSDDAIEQIALDLFRRKITRNVALDALRAHYLDQGDYHNALRAALAVVQRYPFYAGPYLAAASIMVEQRRLDEALFYVDASLDRRIDPEALSLKGSVLLAKGNRPDAIIALEEAMRLDPTLVFTEYNLAGAYALSGRMEDARKAVQSVLRKDPTYRDAQRLAQSLGL